MARLHIFILRNEGFKSTLDDFLVQHPNGLSPTLHKGWLSVKKKGGYYEMHFTTTHPLKLKNGLSVLAYVQYPNNKADEIFYQIVEKTPSGLPFVTGHKKKDGKET